MIHDEIIKTKPYYCTFVSGKIRYRTLEMTLRFSAVLPSMLVIACTGAYPETQDVPDTIPEEPTRVEVISGQAPAAVGGIPSVIMLSRDAGRESDRPVINPDPIIDQFGLVFSPNLLLVEVGQTVTFTNSESLAHNVNLRHLETDRVVLDADTDPAENAHHTFDESGAYDVSCSTHPGMTAFVFASPTPYVVFADPNGDFSFSGVPPGSYKLIVWSNDPELRGERTIEVSKNSITVDARDLS